MSPEINFNDVVDAIHRFQDAKAVSLPQFTRPAIIESPNFMQESLIEEPITNEVIKNLYNIYIGYILVALQMNDMVAGNRRVRDMLGTVSTSSLFNSNAVATESFIDTDRLIKGLSGSLESEYEKVSSTSGSARRYNDKDSLPIASGRQIEVKFAVGEGHEPITVMLNVKFNTRLIPEQVVEYVIGSNFDLSISKRWLQMQAGEIRFIKDFILNLDKLERRENALKSDKDGALRDIFRYQNNTSLRQVMKLAFDHNRSYNLANSILMFDEFTAQRAAKKVGFNFDNVRDRRRFFASTFSLFIVLIDSRYSRVTIYTNGIDQSATFSFNEIKSAASSDKLSLKEIMEYLGKSQMPKF